MPSGSGTTGLLTMERSRAWLPARASENEGVFIALGSVLWVVEAGTARVAAWLCRGRGAWDCEGAGLGMGRLASGEAGMPAARTTPTQVGAWATEQSQMKVG